MRGRSLGNGTLSQMSKERITLSRREYFTISTNGGMTGSARRKTKMRRKRETRRKTKTKTNTTGLLWRDEFESLSFFEHTMAFRRLGGTIPGGLLGLNFVARLERSVFLSTDQCDMLTI